MWQILKSEYQCHKYLLIIPFLLVLTVLTVNLVQGWVKPELNLKGSRTIKATATAVIYFIHLLKNIKEKKDRFFRLLPLPTSQIGFSRLQFITSIWIVFLILFWISTSFADSLRMDLIVWDTIAITGFVLCAIGFPIFYRDLNFIFQSKKILLWLTFFYACVLMTFGTITFLLFSVTKYSWKIFQPLLPLKENLYLIFESPIRAIAFFLFGIFILTASVFSYNQQKNIWNSYETFYYQETKNEKNKRKNINQKI